MYVHKHILIKINHDFVMQLHQQNPKDLISDHLGSKGLQGKNQILVDETAMHSTVTALELS